MTKGSQHNNADDIPTETDKNTVASDMDKKEKLFTEEEKIDTTAENNEVNEMIIDNTTEKEKDDFNHTLYTKTPQHAQPTMISTMNVVKDRLNEKGRVKENITNQGTGKKTPENLND